MNLITYSCLKCKLIHSDGKQINGYLKGRKSGRRITKGPEEAFESAGSAVLMVQRCLHMSNLIKLYYLNMCSLLCVN